METKQELLETVIKSQGGYPDALVRADGTDIRVTVKAAKHSQKEANKIIQLVRSEGGSKDVGVKFDPPAEISETLIRRDFPADYYLFTKQRVCK